MSSKGGIFAYLILCTSLLSGISINPYIDLASPMLTVEKIYLMTGDRQQLYQQIGFECNISATMVLSNRVLYRLLLNAELS